MLLNKMDKFLYSPTLQTPSAHVTVKFIGINDMMMSFSATAYLTFPRN